MIKVQLTNQGLELVCKEAIGVNLHLLQEQRMWKEQGSDGSKCKRKWGQKALRRRDLMVWKEVLRLMAGRTFQRCSTEIKVISEISLRWKMFQLWGTGESSRWGKSYEFENWPFTKKVWNFQPCTCSQLLLQSIGTHKCSAVHLDSVKLETASIASENVSALNHPVSSKGIEQAFLCFYLSTKQRIPPATMYFYLT